MFSAGVVKVSNLAPQVAVQDLHERLGVVEPIEYPQTSLSKPLAEWKMEEDDAPIFRYIYRHIKPRRHLEFGTWEGTGAVYCLEESKATVWTINLLEGEHKPDGSWAYGNRFAQDERVRAWSNKQEFTDDQGLPIVWYQTDALGFIGRFIRERGFAHRVCQIYCDSRDWDVSNYPEGFFDTVLVDGSHTEEVVISDTRKALGVLRSGGLIMWHEFCLDAAARESCPTVQGVVGALEQNWDWVSREMSDLFWVSPSWILIGVKRKVK